MNMLQQVNLFLNTLMNLKRTQDIVIAIKTTQSAIRFYSGLPYERVTVEEVKTTIEVAGKVFKNFSQSQQEIDLIDFTVNFSKTLIDILANPK